MVFLEPTLPRVHSRVLCLVRLFVCTQTVFPASTKAIPFAHHSRSHYRIFVAPTYQLQEWDLLNPRLVFTWYHKHFSS